MNADNELTCKPRGIVEDAAGRVAGFWVRGRKGRRHLYTFARPIEREAPYRVEEKDILVDGEPHRVPVRVYPLVDSLLHWGKR